MLAFSVAPVVWSARRRGGLSAQWRVSRRSFSGAVVAVRFSCPRRAGGFARWWSVKCGVSCSVVHRSGAWWVSVPVKHAPVVPGARHALRVACAVFYLSSPGPVYKQLQVLGVA